MTADGWSFLVIITKLLQMFQSNISSVLHVSVFCAPSLLSQFWSVCKWDTSTGKYGVNWGCEALAAHSTLKLCIHKNEFFSSRLIIFHSRLSDHRIRLHMARQEKSSLVWTNAGVRTFWWLVFSLALTKIIPRIKYKRLNDVDQKRLSLVCRNER